MMTNPFKQRNNAKTTIFIIMLFAIETIVQRRVDKSTPRRTDNVELSLDEYKIHAKRSQQISPRPEEHAAFYSISDNIKNEYEQWHALVWNLSQMKLQPTNWTPGINDWHHHPRDRSDRFPSVAQRVQYYMGKWYNSSIPMYGKKFEKATFIQRKTTREFGPYSNILVNLYNLDKGRLLQCYESKKEMKVFSPYCRDYTDIAILHSEGSANVLHYIGDGLPYISDEIRRYPLFAKVRHLCDADASEFKNNPCWQTESWMQPILLPLNRKRHYGVASIVPENDIPWELKKGRAVWRGKYRNVHDASTHLVSKHHNSTLVDSKFSKNTIGVSRHLVGSYMDMRDQLTYKYIISIEGNDVSSGLKWMLLSNSVVLTPPFTMESWAMEGKLKPFVHFIPLKADMSNVEDMIRWAEMHPKETRLISERSTLFVYDEFFHPDAIKDEKEIMIRIMERYEQNFGHDAETRQQTLGTHSNKLPPKRARFPSVEERVEYLMGKWYHNEDAISMQRSKLRIVSHSSLNNTISRDRLFVASGHHLSECAMANSTFSKDIRLLCQSSLQHFDERLTADLKSNSFNRLRQSETGAKIRFAPKSSWRHDGDNAIKESKRVILDDIVKIICIGNCSREGVNANINTRAFPYFASYRQNNDAILWPFNLDYVYNIAKNGLLENLDINFEDKTAAASIGIRKIPFTVNESSSKKNDRIRDMLSHRYLLATDSVEGINEDLIWMLLSKSVVLMPGERQFTSSWLMESFLEPYLHFIPVAPDYSDVHKKISWCENNLEKARDISERATIFVHDMLLDRSSKKEIEEIKFQVMERYSKIFG